MPIARNYQVSKKKQKKTKHYSDIYGDNLQVKKLNLTKELDNEIEKRASHLTSTKIKARQNIENEYVMLRLIEKHKDNIQAMIHDKLNTFQWTEGKLLKEYNLFMKINDTVDVKLTEKYLKGVKLDENDDDQIDEDQKVDTMNIQYANRIEQLQKAFRDKK